MVEKVKVKLSLCLTKYHAMEAYPFLIKCLTIKTYGVLKVQLHEFLTLALHGGEWLASHPNHFSPGKRASSIHWIRGRVGSKACLDMVTK